MNLGKPFPSRKREYHRRRLDPTTGDESKGQAPAPCPREEEPGRSPSDVIPSTRFILDPSGNSTHDATTVDVVAVACPGADPLQTWARDGLLSYYFGAPSMRKTEEATGSSRRQGPSWIRQGIRREANCARICLYQYPPLTDGTTLNMLAENFLADLQDLRTVEGQEKPLLFISHSIGGLVVKLALARASFDPSYQTILRECYGVAFFGKLPYIG